MKKIILGFLTIVLILLSITVYAQDRTTTYWLKTNETATVAWTAEDSIIGDMYELKLIWVETSHEFNIGETAELEYIINAPRVGHFNICVRAKRLVSGTWLYSSWSISTDPTVALVDGNPEGWRIYWRMAPPGPIIITKYKEENKNGKNQRTNYFLGAGQCTGLIRIQSLLGKNNKFRRYCNV